ncbi:unnamed protein product [Kuraishia capsulata CBS 1993]|uniref:Dystroglycan-type cadherin-like domain-containing protein n=1 Tax=Kuraishia capsulata CBS 1993 TaxID=1382522 RepID=W6MNB8_9ASCO|nr:uncharacterized protein KUCA_T00003752001 [Kuraishia capsulata CBS 1993]CDK27773.1 unnamed protein product [Kuraishia capsulata CBS 1993]
MKRHSELTAMSVFKGAGALLLLGWLQLVSATPYVGFPLDEQLPNVARVGEEYEFSINKLTYETDDGTVAYSVDGLPSWLSFDSSSLTFSGVPKTDDASTDVPIYLVGTDNSGTLNKTYSIVVSSDPGPSLSSASTLIDQLSAYGDTNGIDGLVLSPGADFNIKFSSKTFEMISGSTNKIKTYYGKSLNRTSLPSWAYFDSDTLTFSGTAPAVNSEIAPSQSFGFILIATDYEGYTGAYGTFDIVVGAHQLSTNMTSPLVINATAGDSFSYTVPLEDVFLDSEIISSSNISSVQLNNAPSWVSLSAMTKISGDVPEDTDENHVFNVTVTDVYSNSVQLEFTIEVLTTVFTVSSLPDVNATRGEFFEYTLDEDDFTNINDTTIKVEFDDNTWLTFFQTNYTFAGNVPSKFKELEISLKATLGSLSTTKKFNIDGIAGKKKKTSSSSSSSSHHSKSSSSSSSSHTSTKTGSTSSVTATPTNNSKSNTSKNSNKKTLAIALGVVIPIVVLVLLGFLLFCCWRRRKSNGSDDEKKKSPDISDPIFINGSNVPRSQSFDTMNSEETTARRLSTLNVLKLDGKHYGDNASINSSTTNVNSTRSSMYEDALQHQPLDDERDAQVRKSWRTKLGDGTWKPHDSLNSLATVATNELLSVRVTDDELRRRSQMSQLMGGYAARNSSSGLLDDPESPSGNYQLYDSNGNITAMKHTDGRFNSNADLQTLSEEDSPLSVPHTHGHQASSIVSSQDFSSESVQEEFRPNVSKSGETTWTPINTSNGSSNGNQAKSFVPSITRKVSAKLVDFTGRGKKTNNDPLPDQDLKSVKGEICEDSASD